jgi:hypothetical protein
LSGSGADPNRTEAPQSPERRAETSPESEELIGEILEELPPEKREKMLEILYMGPIPPPGMLKQFDEVVPGAAKQIMDDAHACASAQA